MTFIIFIPRSLVLCFFFLIRSTEILGASYTPVKYVNLTEIERLQTILPQQMHLNILFA